MSVFSVILIEVIGPEKFKSCLGFVTVVHGTSIAVFFPIAGMCLINKIPIISNGFD
jgi:hypothetical protein